MSINATCRRRLVLGVLLVFGAFPACGKKEQAATSAPASPAPAVTTTTTTILPVPSPSPTPPPAWRAARWGMSHEELLAAFPGEAQRLARPENFGQPVAGAGEVAIPAWEAAGTKFRVLFAFDSGTLDRIHLAAPKPTVDTCTELEKQLAQEHGTAASRSETGTSLRGDAISWSAPTATITLSCFERPSLGFRLVTLDYVPPATRAAAP